MEELNSSELGTHVYWESRYEEEIKNFCNHGDPGETWFGEDITDRIIQWLNKTYSVKKSSKFVDIGCGNGMFLIELANEGYQNLYGVDYSEKAIELAKAITKKRNLDINYSTCNILEGLNDLYEIIHDKGTYDAISLSENAAENRKKYIESVFNSLENSGLFIITSCNWTQSELREQFADKFQPVEIIPTPQFKFGGKVGNLVSSCVFKKNDSVNYNN